MAATGDLIDLFRDEMSDTEQPPLWNDDLLFAYIDDAQSMFCRRTDGIADTTTPEVTQIVIVPGVDQYATHTSIKQIRRVTRADTGREIDVLSPENMARRGMRFDRRIGRVGAVITGLEANLVRIWPVPDSSGRVARVTSADADLADTELQFDNTSELYPGMAVSGTGIDANTRVVAVDDGVVTLSKELIAPAAEGTAITFDLVLQLDVFRLPVTKVVDDQALEVAPLHHPHLLLWVKHRAYLKQDAEAFDRTKSQEFRDMFFGYCQTVFAEQQRARHKTRVVAYGGL